MDERQLFSTIYDLGGMIWFINHDLADGRMEETPKVRKTLEDLQREIENAVDQTVHFGVDVPRTVDGPTEEYWKWYYACKEKYSEME